MNDSEDSPEPDIVEGFKKRLLATVVARMEGTIDRRSAEDLHMFDELLDELLQEENIILSRSERKRLSDELLSSI